MAVNKAQLPVNILGVASTIVLDRVRLSKLDQGWVQLRVPVVPSQGTKGGSLEVWDNRPGSVEAAAAVFTTSAEISLVRRRKKAGNLAELKRRLREELEAFQEAFSGPAKVAVEEKVVVGGKFTYHRLILNDPKEAKGDGLLTIVRTVGKFHRDPVVSPLKPIWGRNGNEEAALHLIFATSSQPIIIIWELGEEKIREWRVTPEGIERRVATFEVEEMKEKGEIEIGTEDEDEEEKQRVAAEQANALAAEKRRETAKAENEKQTRRRKRSK